MPRVDGAFALSDRFRGQGHREGASHGPSNPSAGEPGVRHVERDRAPLADVSVPTFQTRRGRHEGADNAAGCRPAIVAVLTIALSSGVSARGFDDLLESTGLFRLADR